MCKIFIIGIITCAILLPIKNVECLSNPGRFLDCWPVKLKFNKFAVNFYFSSRNHKYQRMNNEAVIGKDIDFDPSRRTTVIVHGMGGSSHEFNVKTLGRHLLLWQDMNVVALDWRIGSGNALIYPQAVVNTEYAALALKNLSVRLSQTSGKPAKDWAPVHFIGHSLGAHVVGQAAEMLKKANLTIDRVTGLDPAEPCFLNAKSPLRLRRSNAQFVDVIHTDGATQNNNRFGLLEKLGHADFYVNGGSIQPGCYNLENGRDLDIGSLVIHMAEDGSCHHIRAFTLFIESVIQARVKICRFWAHPWRLGTNKLETSHILNEECNEKNCIEMGINAELYDHRDATYYVKTTDSAPYCNVSK